MVERLSCDDLGKTTMKKLSNYLFTNILLLTLFVQCKQLYPLIARSFSLQLVKE